VWITFSAYAPESADSTSDCMQDSEQLAESLARSAWWRGKPSPSRSWDRRLRKKGWTTFLSGSEICENYPCMNFLEWTGSPEAIHANPSAKQESDWEKTTLVICGRSSSTSSELFDLAESSSKTSLDTCHSASIASFKTWQAAVSAARSDCLQRRKSARHIDESESSSSGWPTASARDWKDTPGMSRDRDGKANRRIDQLPRAVYAEADGREFFSLRIAQETERTGISSVHARSTTPNATALDRLKMASNTELSMESSTVDESTSGPRDRESGNEETNRGGLLNPDWVEMLMGFPIGWTDCGR
jgi:hypothetical protein